MATKRPKKVMVKWEDSAATSGWYDLDRKPYGAVMCYSAGWLIEDTKKHVVLALNWNEGQCGDYMTIPRSAVRKVKRLH